MWQAGEFAWVIRFAVHHARMPHTLAVNHTRFCKKCGETHTRSISSQVQMSRAMAVKLVHNGCRSPVRAPHFSPSRRLQLRQGCLSLEVGKSTRKAYASVTAVLEWALTGSGTISSAATTPLQVEDCGTLAPRQGTISLPASRAPQP